MLLLHVQIRSLYGAVKVQKLHWNIAGNELNNAPFGIVETGFHGTHGGRIFVGDIENPLETNQGHLMPRPVLQVFYSTMGQTGETSFRQFIGFSKHRAPETGEFCCTADGDLWQRAFWAQWWAGSSVLGCMPPSGLAMPCGESNTTFRSQG